MVRVRVSQYLHMGLLCVCVQCQHHTVTTPLHVTDTSLLTIPPVQFNTLERLKVVMTQSCFVTGHPSSASSLSDLYTCFCLRGSNSRALKVAGLTTLACLLLASQVFTAYMVVSQKGQINSLQKNSEKMGKQLTRSSQGKRAYLSIGQTRVNTYRLPLGGRRLDQDRHLTWLWQNEVPSMSLDCERKTEQKSKDDVIVVAK